MEHGQKCYEVHVSKLSCLSSMQSMNRRNRSSVGGQFPFTGSHR